MNSKPKEPSGRRRPLGRGLSSLLGETDLDPVPDGQSVRYRTIPIDRIEPGRAQPRRDFDKAELAELAASIAKRGVLQPVLLRRLPDDPERFEIIAGERRWRAAQLAQIHRLPAIIKDSDDAEALELALIENVQRSDLAPLEEADGFRRLVNEFGRTQDRVATIVGKSRSHVANTLRLLTLPDVAREHLRAGRISAGHARALLGTENADQLAETVVSKGLSVRATEQLAKRKTGNEGGKGPTEPRARPDQPEDDPDILALESSITENTGLKARIKTIGAEAGTLTIHYRTLEQLDQVLARLTGPTASR